MGPQAISPAMPVVELLAVSSAAPGLLLELHLDCPGCPMTRFCSLEDVCRQYEMNLDQFLMILQERIPTYESN